MSAAIIAQLLIQFGPPALGLIEDLVKLWSKPSLTVEEVLAFTGKAKKSYDDYIAEAQAKGAQPPPP